MKKYLQKLQCKIGLHDLEFVSRTKDWLMGGAYTYQCKRCGHVVETAPYQGGEW